MLKKYKYVFIAAGLIAIGLILIFSSKIFDNSKESEPEFSYELYTTELEEKIESFLLKVNGIKNVDVIITLDTSSEKVYAQNQTTLDFVTVNSGGSQSPVYIAEIYPTVRGIAVSCTNGDNIEVKERLTRLLSAYLGISSNRIEIVNFG